MVALAQYKFLSTLPARGATSGPANNTQPSPYFYPRSPRGERPTAVYIRRAVRRQFLSTLPARGATFLHCGVVVCQAISIHAPREGSDAPPPRQPPGESNFYPRSPRGERLHARAVQFRQRFQFLSTLPARGATRRSGVEIALVVVFLSTLPARGATIIESFFFERHSHFYPRSPRGERPFVFDGIPGDHNISIHAPREGSDIT